MFCREQRENVHSAQSTVVYYGVRRMMSYTVWDFVKVYIARSDTPNLNMSDAKSVTQLVPWGLPVNSSLEVISTLLLL